MYTNIFFLSIGLLFISEYHNHIIVMLSVMKDNPTNCSIFLKIKAKNYVKALAKFLVFNVRLSCFMTVIGTRLECHFKIAVFIKIDLAFMDSKCKRMKDTHTYQ